MAVKVRDEITLIRVDDGAAGEDGQDGENGKMLHGTSSTAASTAAKVVACAEAKSLYAGLTVLVEFSTANTAAAPTLNVNSLGAKQIYINGAVADSSNLFLWGEGAKIQFTYNGTYWIPVGHPCAYYGTSSTAAATAAKTSTIAGIVVCKGTTVGIKFTYANSADSPRLNLSSVGAKAVYTQGVAFAYWQAGATVSFTFDGTYWRVSSEPVYANVATIGNSSGRNIYIDGLKVYIRNGITVLAAFAEDEIVLGENSGSSVIKMCGDNIELGVASIDDEQHNYLYSEVLNIGVKKPNEMGAASSAGLFMQGDTVDISGNLKYKENPIEDLLKWNLLKEVSNVAFGSVTISSLSLYREFLLTVGPCLSGSNIQSNRILASAVIPVSAMLNTKGNADPNGMHQAYYSDTYWAGLNCLNDTTIQIRASGESAIAKLWAR